MTCFDDAIRMRVKYASVPGLVPPPRVSANPFSLALAASRFMPVTQPILTNQRIVRQGEISLRKSRFFIPYPYIQARLLKVYH